MNCRYCEKTCVKAGVRNCTQRYRCTCCKKYQQAAYVKPRIPQEKYEWTLKLNNEGCGISNIARLLRVSKSSVQRLIERIAASLPTPQHNERRQRYEIDELRTYCGSKANELWLIYAINRQTRRIAAYLVGRRIKENVAQVVRELESRQPVRIYSDMLNIYESLIKANVHGVYPRCTNYVERKNLTLRTHLKRLSRRSICFTKSASMLNSCVALYCCAA